MSKKSSDENACRIPEIRPDGFQRAPGRELTVVPVVHEEQVGGFAPGDRRGKASDQLIPFCEGEKLRVDLVLRRVERVDDGAIGLDLLRIAGDHHGDPRVLITRLRSATHRNHDEDDDQGRSKSQPSSHHHLLE